MNHHVRNPWTRSPQVFLHLTVEEANQLRAGLVRLNLQESGLDDNMRDALATLERQLQHVCSTPPPHGIKGVMP